MVFWVFWVGFFIANPAKDTSSGGTHRPWATLSKGRNVRENSPYDGLCYFVPALLLHSHRLMQNRSTGHRYFASQSRQSAKLFLKSSKLGLPQPLTRRQVCPPHPPILVGGVHSLAREGLGESQLYKNNCISNFSEMGEK